jgi:hypothetical protein
MQYLRIKIGPLNIMTDLVNKYAKLVRGAGNTVGHAVADTVREPFASPEKEKKGEAVVESDAYQTGYVIGISLYFIWLVVFASGAATQSYRYNLNVGTGVPLTVLYLVLAFLFPFFYYPFYTFFLCNGKGGQHGGRR